MTPAQAEDVRKLYREARERKRMTRERVAQLAGEQCDRVLDTDDVRFLECLLSSHLNPEKARPIAAVLGVPWERVLQAMGMA